MKKTFYPFLLVGLVAACQQQKPTAQVQVLAKPTIHSSSAVALPAASLPTLFKVADTLTIDGQTIARRYDFGRLWEGQPPRRENPVLEGVFGPDHYRFELVIGHAMRDPRRPDYYRVSGKCHYRKNVRPFSGWLIIRGIEPLEPPYNEDDGSFVPAIRPDAVSPDSFEARKERVFAKVDSYQLRAELRLAEQPAANSGELRGEAILNFYVAPPARLGYVLAPMRATDGIWREETLLMRGSRRNMTTKQLKWFVVADNVFVAAADVYQDFGIGDRGYEIEINPKYSHLGWNEKWENDEWWADSPKPKLSL